MQALGDFPGHADWGKSTPPGRPHLKREHAEAVRLREVLLAPRRRVCPGARHIDRRGLRLTSPVAKVSGHPVEATPQASRAWRHRRVLPEETSRTSPQGWGGGPSSIRPGFAPRKQAPPSSTSGARPPPDPWAAPLPTIMCPAYLWRRSFALQRYVPEPLFHKGSVTLRDYVLPCTKLPCYI